MSNDHISVLLTAHVSVDIHDQDNVPVHLYNTFFNSRSILHNGLAFGRSGRRRWKGGGGLKEPEGTDASSSSL